MAISTKLFSQISFLKQIEIAVAFLFFLFTSNLKKKNLIMIFFLQNVYFLVFLSLFKQILCQKFDLNGYIVYCPCMGRFGNQAEQFLGTFQFAKHLNRTLVLPPFIQYSKYNIDFLPFENVINITALSEYHRVVTMTDFMNKMAPHVWPQNERSIFCYSARKLDSISGVDSCNSHEGSPFRDFWLNSNISNFSAGSVFYSPLHTDYNFSDDWKAKYFKYSVIAFVGAPSSFPTNKKAVQLQRFVYFADKLKTEASNYGESRGLKRIPYLSIHIRHGQDWMKACRLIETNDDLKTLFSSQQCLGNYPERRVTFDLCLPDFDQIVTWIESTIRNHPKENIRTVHIASDFENITLWKELHTRLAHSLTIVSATHTIHPNGKITRYDSSKNALIDLYLMTQSNIFIGNCISSFTAFVSRYRIYNHHLSDKTFFFSFEEPLKVAHYKHDEL